MKKIFFTLLSLITFSMLFLVNFSYASSYTFTAEANKTTLYPGEDVKINLEVSDINVPSDGINVVETTLLYDKSVFESFEFIEMNSWKHTYNSNEGNLFGKLLYTKMVSGVSQKEKIGALKFKLKKDLPEMETQIKLLQVTSNDGFELMNEGDKIITLKIVHKKTTSTKPEEPEEPEKPEENPIIPDNINGVQTGDFIIIIVSLLLFVIIVNVIIFIYSKNKKNFSKINHKTDKKM